ncbi:MAG: acetyl-CoA acetyltransferase, partial [Bradyrhizobium sp.]|nr:acetyl-CoA acetyltransferase [Bradyrhizobium sp.]
RGGAGLGLLYGQGGFVTKHHALVVSRQAPRSAIAQDASVQAEADRNQRSVPPFVTDASGKGKIESFTVLFRQGGEVEHGVVMLRTEQDTRTLARVPATDIVTLPQLMNMERTPVGALGDITMAADDMPEWRVA